MAALRRAVPATKGNTRRLATLGPLLKDLEARVIDENGSVMPARGVGVIELRGESLTPGYITMGGFIPAQDEHGWYDTGDLGYLTDEGHVVVCGRVKDVIIMAGRNIYPTDIERAAGRVEGVRPGCAVAVRLDAGHSRESFAVAVESNAFEDPAEVRRIEHQVAHEVVKEVDVRPRNVVVLGPGTIPKTPSGKLRRSNSVTWSLVGARVRAREQTQKHPFRAEIGCFCVCSRGMATPLSLADLRLLRSLRRWWSLMGRRCPSKSREQHLCAPHSERYWRKSSWLFPSS